ncbi:MAG: BatD family protein, partial [Spirochaetia bacterium]|nr:BatD family protein [Spirochaetia bacterium]
VTFENIPDFDRTPHQVQLGDKTYQAQVIRSRLLIPGLIGKHDIKGGVLRVEKAGGFWGGPARNIAIPEVSLQALPFPEKGKPASFRNAVGEFQIRMTADGASVRTHDPVMVRIEVSGSGNFKMLILPQVPVEHPDLTVKRASLRESYKLSQNTYRGSIVAEYFVIPKKDGTFKVPDLEWSYFSPEQSAYVTLRAPGFVFRAQGGAASTNRSSEPAGTASYEKLVVNEDLLFIKTPERENWDAAADLLASPWSLAVHGAGLLLIGLGFFSRRIRFAKGRSEESTLGRAIRSLREARTEPGLDGFYEKIERALQDYVVEKFGLSGGLSLAEMKAALAETMDRHPGLAEILGRVKQCQTARYAPDRSTEIPRHWVDENENLLTLLDRELSLKEERPG